MHETHKCYVVCRRHWFDKPTWSLVYRWWSCQHWSYLQYCKPIVRSSNAQASGASSPGRYRSVSAKRIADNDPFNTSMTSFFFNKKWLLARRNHLFKPIRLQNSIKLFWESTDYNRYSEPPVCNGNFERLTSRDNAEIKVSILVTFLMLYLCIK